MKEKVINDIKSCTLLERISKGIALTHSVDGIDDYIELFLHETLANRFIEAYSNNTNPELETIHVIFLTDCIVGIILEFMKNPKINENGFIWTKADIIKRLEYYLFKYVQPEIQVSQNIIPHSLKPLYSNTEFVFKLDVKHLKESNDMRAEFIDNIKRSNMNPTSHHLDSYIELYLYDNALRHFSREYYSTKLNKNYPNITTSIDSIVESIRGYLKDPIITDPSIVDCNDLKYTEGEIYDSVILYLSTKLHSEITVKWNEPLSKISEEVTLSVNFDN